jgi:hypothetical protein
MQRRHGTMTRMKSVLLSRLDAFGTDNSRTWVYESVLSLMGRQDLYCRVAQYINLTDILTCCPCALSRRVNERRDRVPGVMMSEGTAGNWVVKRFNIGEGESPGKPASAPEIKGSVLVFY